MAKYAGKLKKLMGKGISSVRRQRGFTQEDFSETAKVSLSTLQKIESGKQWPGADILEAILNALNTTLGEVADFNEEAKPSSPEVMNQIKALRVALDALEASHDVLKMRGIERRLRQAEPVARRYKSLESHLGEELIERLLNTNEEDIELLKATLPKLKSGVKKLQN